MDPKVAADSFQAETRRGQVRQQAGMVANSQTAEPTIIVASTSDDSWIVLPVCMLFAVGLAYLCYLGPDEFEVKHPNAVFNSSLAPWVLAFVALLLLWKVYRTIWPTRYSTELFDDAMVFRCSNRHRPDHVVARSETACIRLERRRWYQTPDFSQRIIISLVDGSEVKVDVRYVWAGNRSEFLTAVQSRWGPQAIQSPEVSSGGE